MINKKNIDKANFLESLAKNLEIKTICEAIDSDKSIDVLTRNKLKRIITGFKNNESRYKDLHENNLDYFTSVLQPLSENKVVKYINTVDDFVSLVENLGGKVDVAGVTKNTINAFNESYTVFKKKYPEYDYKDLSMIGVYERVAHNEFMMNLHTIYEENYNKNAFSFSKYKANILEGKKNISDIVNDMDDTTVQLAWGVIAGKLEKYSDTIRDKVVDFLTKYPNDKKSVTIIGESFASDVAILESDEDKEGFIQNIINSEEEEGITSIEEAYTNDYMNGLLKFWQSDDKSGLMKYVKDRLKTIKNDPHIQSSFEEYVKKNDIKGLYDFVEYLLGRLNII
jgi:hypothetical protein